MAQIGTTPVIQEEPCSAENLLAVKSLMTALESMCQEIAKSKAEVACIAVYEKDIFVVGTERGRSFIGNRKDFQIDFVKYLESKPPAGKENTQISPGSFVPVQVKTEPCDDNQPSTSVEPVLIKAEVEDPDYYPYSVQDSTQQEHSETSEDPEVEVTIEDDEYFPPNKRPKITVQSTDAGATVKRKSRKFNFDSSSPLPEKSAQVLTPSSPEIEVTIEGTSVEPVLIKAEVEDPDYYPYSVQGHDVSLREKSHPPESSNVEA